MVAQATWLAETLLMLQMTYGIRLSGLHSLARLTEQEQLDGGGEPRGKLAEALSR